jgi:Predicted DNA modification methylase
MTVGLTSYDKVKSVDWNFKDVETTYLSHSYHSYPARFIPQIPQTIIENFTSKGDFVLDPFCGCGTTLVESVLRGRRAVGIDINPNSMLDNKGNETEKTGKVNYWPTISKVKSFITTDWKKWRLVNNNEDELEMSTYQALEAYVKQYTPDWIAQIILWIKVNEDAKK